MTQIINKISPIINSGNIQSLLGGRVSPMFNHTNPGAYYQDMNNFRTSGYQMTDPSQSQLMAQSQAQNWGQTAQAPGTGMGIGTPAQQGWGQTQQNAGIAGMGAALGGIIGSLTGNNQSQQQGQGWGQPTPAQQGWGQTQQNAGIAGMGAALGGIIGSLTGNNQSQQQGQGWGQPTPAPAPTQSTQAPTMISTSNTGFSNRPRNFGSGVVLKKGQKVNLSTDNSIHEVDICLGWDAVPGYDLDASAFLLGANGKVLGDDWFVFYGQQDSPDRAVHHSGNSTGEGAGDDEIINIKLDQLNQVVQKIVFIVTIDSALQNGYNFSNVRNAYMRVVNRQNNQELMRFSLSDYYANVTSMVVGELYRHNGTWKLNPVGDGVAADLAGLCARYGVNVAS